MRTNVVLDDNLVQEGLKITGLKTRRALLDYALKELIRHKDQAKVLKLKGKIHWEGDLDQLREGRFK